MNKGVDAGFFFFLLCMMLKNARLILSWSRRFGENLTNEGDGCGEAGPDVSGQAVLHGELQVLKLPLEEIGACWGHVENSCDARCTEGLSAGGVEGTAQIQEGQQLHGAILFLEREN